MLDGVRDHWADAHLEAARLQPVGRDAALVPTVASVPLDELLEGDDAVERHPQAYAAPLTAVRVPARAFRRRQQPARSHRAPRSTPLRGPDGKSRRDYTTGSPSFSKNARFRFLASETIFSYATTSTQARRLSLYPK